MSDSNNSKRPARLNIHKAKLVNLFYDTYDTTNYNEVINKFAKEGVRTEITCHKDDDDDIIWTCRVFIGSDKIGFFRFFSDIEIAVYAAFLRFAHKKNKDIIPWVEEK